MNKTLRYIAIAALAALTGGSLAQTTPSQTDTEINLLKLEVQRLRGDIDIMKGHIGRLVQYLQQRDSQSIAPQLQPQPQPQARLQPGQPEIGRAHV